MNDKLALKIKAAAIKMLARREHSQLELIEKLRRHYELDKIQDVVQQLAQDDWQSELRFAQMWVRSRSHRGYGPLRISYELQHKGINKQLITKAVYQQDIDWCNQAWWVYQKKFDCSTLQELGWEERGKRIKFMLYRGFSKQHLEHMALV